MDREGRITTRCSRRGTQGWSLAAELGVRQIEAMTRAGAIAAHIGALPAAVLLSVFVGLALPWHRPVDVQLHDTLFVAAHFHMTVALVVSVSVASMVVYRYGSMNGPIMGAWALLVIHCACSLMWTSVWLNATAALACLLALVLGVAMSVWRITRGSTWNA